MPPSNGAPMITFGPKIESGYLAQPQLYRLDKTDYEEQNEAAQHPDLVKEYQDLINRLRSGKETR